MLTFFNVLHKRKKAMFKKDPLLNGLNLTINKNSKNYKKLKAILKTFEKQHKLHQNQSLSFYSISNIHYKFNPGPFCPIKNYH